MGDAKCSEMESIINEEMSLIRYNYEWLNSTPLK